jgi:hypothetical protein
MYATTVPYILSGILLCTRYRKKLHSFLQRIQDTINYFTTHRYYLFFEEYSMPFQVYSLKRDDPLLGEATLVYDAENTLFFPFHTEKTIADLLNEYTPQPLPILSMEIIDASSNSVRDLTGFIETLRYVHVPNYPAPTICDIIGAWAASNCVPIDRRKYDVRYITTDGDEITVSLTDTSLLEAEVPVVEEEAVLEPDMIPISEETTEPLIPSSDDENGD